MTTELPIPRTTLNELVATYTQSALEIRQAFAQILAAQERLQTAFGGDYSFSIASRMQQERLEFDDSEKLLGELKKDAWRVLVARMELRRVLSVAACKQLDAQLETGKDLPEIEEQTVLAMLEGTLARTTEFLNEAVREVFEYLRPPGSHLKTNTEFEIGPRVILEWAVERCYRSPQFRMNHHRIDQIRAVDNVFHALDGQGSVKSHQGPLVDAILASPDGKGETAYFLFKCFQNGNLHLQFKRLDLLARLNEIGGGNRLRSPGKQTAQPPEANNEVILAAQRHGATEHLEVAGL